MELKTATGKLSPRQELVFDDLGEQGFPVHILHSKEDVEDFIKYATSQQATSVSTGDYIQGAVGAELGSISTPWTWEDDDNADDYRRATQGENTYHSAKEGSGNSVGHRGKKVGTPKSS